MPANSVRNSGTLVASASIARRPGNGEAMIARIWKATSPTNTTSQMISIVTTTEVEERSKGSR